MQITMIIGNLTKDPETRSLPTGITVCAFTVAVNRGDKTEFFRVNAWRKLGELCQKYLTKGKKVAVVGELSMRNYTAKDGTEKTSVELTADKVEFLSSKSKETQETQIEGLESFTSCNEELPF